MAKPMELSALTLSRARSEKKEVGEAKLEKGESIDKVKEWGQEIEERIDFFITKLRISKRT